MLLNASATPSCRRRHAVLDVTSPTNKCLMRNLRTELTLKFSLTSTLASNLHLNRLSTPQKWGEMNKHSNRHTSEEVQDAFKVLMTHVFCNSHDVSHFAAFFIVVGAKTSVAESVGLRFVMCRSTLLSSNGVAFPQMVKVKKGLIHQV